MSARKRPRHTGNPALVEPRTPTRSRNQGNPSTLPDTGIDPDDDVAEESVPHGTVGSHARRATLEVGEALETSTAVSQSSLEELKHSVQRLDEQVAQLKPSSSMESRLQTLEQSHSRLEDQFRALQQSHSRLEGQLDILLRMQQYAARPPASAPAPPSL